jgi:RimJ/RimL family protein N-acetyltransferase
MGVELVALEGRHVRLEPLAVDHADALLSAAAEDRTSYAYSWVPQDRDEIGRYLDKMLADQRAGAALSFVQRRQPDGKVVGHTRFFNMEWWSWPLADGDPDVVEIGSTWLAASAQRTLINTEAKLLMFGHAFDRWHAQRVYLKTDARNDRSRRAILRIGASFEGVLRSSMPRYNEVGARDSAYFSVIASEWPAVRARLDGLVASG